jgi:citrate/tricarballylate utilization protein
MPFDDLVKEAGRVMVICNACRYCEGYCAVFPAMERRRTFSEKDLKYLANLCHDCRGCYYACQYAPPHEFDLNFPKALGELRLETYRQFTRPGFLAGLFRRNGTALFLISVLGIAAVFLLALMLQGVFPLFSAHAGENSFYRVIPYLLIVLPFSAVALYALACIVSGMIAFWREIGGSPGELADFVANRKAIGEVLRLKYLDGGGYGCNYPDDRFSLIRRRFHHLVFYGVLLCFASTTVAAVYHHLFHWNAPYLFFSWPVVLGTAGGLSLLAGTAGLLYLKQRMDPEPAVVRSYAMDAGFLGLLFLTSLTGLLLLFLRETPAMGILLTVHLGLVLGLFITLPYGKFVHAGYRYLALVRNAREEAGEKPS